MKFVTHRVVGKIKWHADVPRTVADAQQLLRQVSQGQGRARMDRVLQ